MELGKDMESSEIEQRIAEQKPEQCALLVYTVSSSKDIEGLSVIYCLLILSLALLETLRE